MEELGDWSKHDNKKYIGKIDRIYVSMTEDYEVEYFIDQYLKTHKYEVLLVVEGEFRRGHIAFPPSIHWPCEPTQEAFNVRHELANCGQCPHAADLPLPYPQILNQLLKIICRQSMAVSEQLVQRCIQPVLAERVARPLHAGHLLKSFH